MATLAQLVLMLSSDQPGECVAAARAIDKTLRRDGRDWHWLAAKVNGQASQDGSSDAAVRAAYERGRRDAEAAKDAPRQDIFNDHQAAAEWLLDNHGSRLRDHERDFLETMLDWRGEPTDKQAKWLNALCRRYGYRP